MLNSYKIFNNKQYKSYFLLFFFISLALSLRGPLPLLFAHHGFGEEVFGLFLSAVALGSMLVPPTMAFLSVRLGATGIGIMGCAIGFVAAVGLGIASTWIIFPLAFLLQLSNDAFSYSVENKIDANIPEDRRSKYFALKGLFNYGAISLGMFAGGLVAARLGISVVYMAYSMFFLLAAAAIFAISKMLKNVNSNVADAKKSNKGLMKKVFKNRAFWGFAMVNALSSWWLIAMSFLPLFGLALGFDVSEMLVLIGVLTVINAVGGLVVGKIFDERDLASRKAVYIAELAGDALPAATFIAFANPIVFVVAYIFINLKGALWPVCHAFFFDCFANEEEARAALGMLSSISYAVQIGLPIVIGILWVRNPSIVFGISAVATSIAAVGAVILMPSKTRAA